MRKVLVVIFMEFALLWRLRITYSWKCSRGVSPASPLTPTVTQR
jgi:hypothetical protein